MVDPEGKFKPLHKFNPIRISYIKENIIKTFHLELNKTPLKNIKILDIGCGGVCCLNQCADWVQMSLELMHRIKILMSQNSFKKK